MFGIFLFLLNWFTKYEIERYLFYSVLIIKFFFNYFSKLTRIHITHTSNIQWILICSKFTYTKGQYDRIMLLYSAMVRFCSSHCIRFSCLRKIWIMFCYFCVHFSLWNMLYIHWTQFTSYHQFVIAVYISSPHNCIFSYAWTKRISAKDSYMPRVGGRSEVALGSHYNKVEVFILLWYKFVLGW